MLDRHKGAVDGGHEEAEEDRPGNADRSHRALDVPLDLGLARLVVVAAEAGAIRETFEETGSKAEIIMPYTMFSLPHINQVHMFYLADLLDENFGPTVESSEVKLFQIDEILWDEIAFPTVKKTLEYYIEDKEINKFIFREEDIKLW